MKNFAFSELPRADLVVEAVYEGKRERPFNLGLQPLTKLIPGVSNMGGFRARIGKSGSPVGLVLMSTGIEIDWPDSLDIFQGIYTYYGDNRQPGKALHETSRGGNRHLASIFELAHGTAEDRLKCPVILIFENTGHEHDAMFKGLAVPGGKNLSMREDLIAQWAATGGKRFQNYQAQFTVLNVGEIDGSWVRDIFALQPISLQDSRMPRVLKKWIIDGKYEPLTVDPKSFIRTVSQQLPKSEVEIQIIREVTSFCSKDPWLFEGIARDIWQMAIASDMEIGLTRKSQDGGRDALGRLILGPGVDPLKIEFVLEAKCFAENQTVTTKHMSRLVSRIKHREFGVMVTTSAVAPQAYTEVRADGHPIVILSGQDIAQILIGKGLNNREKIKVWMGTVDQERP